LLRALFILVDESWGGICLLMHSFLSELLVLELGVMSEVVTNLGKLLLEFL